MSTPETDLGVNYFSSAVTNSWIIQDQKDNPHDYVYQVINTFELRKEAIWHEICLHKIFNVGANPDFYNGSIQTSTRFDITGTTHSTEAIVKMRNAKRGFKNSQFGKPHTNSTKDKMRNAHSINKHQQGCTNSQFGTMWIYNIKLEVSKKIAKEELLEFERAGWLKGRKMKF